MEFHKKNPLETKMHKIPKIGYYQNLKRKYGSQNKSILYSFYK